MSTNFLKFRNCFFDFVVDPNGKLLLLRTAYLKWYFINNAPSTMLDAALNTLVHEKEYRFPISYVELDESVYGLLVLLLENDLAIDEKVNFRESTHITRTARIIDIAQKMIARLPDYQRHGSTYTSTAIWLCSEANTVLSH